MQLVEITVTDPTIDPFTDIAVTQRRLLPSCAIVLTKIMKGRSRSEAQGCAALSKLELISKATTILESVQVEEHMTPANVRFVGGPLLCEILSMAA